MDYSNFKLIFLVRNDLVDFVIPKMPKDKSGLSYFNPSHTTDLLRVAMENNSVKSFDVILKNLDELKAFNWLCGSDYIEIAIKSVYLHGNLYFAQKLVDYFLEAGWGTDNDYLLNFVNKLRYNLESSKESTKTNHELKTKYIHYILSHPKFKLESFMAGFEVISSDLKPKTIKIIREYLKTHEIN